jgi:DNA-binding response OmpR family regulator
VTSKTILIVEDDPTLRRGLKDNFEFEGYQVRTAADGEKGLELACNARCDLILLDIMLPGVNGYEICRLVRQEKLTMPIIMLTAKGQESDIILGLNLGADDYVTKPFSIRELLARVRAFLRRQETARTRSHAFGPYHLDCDSRRLTRAGQEVPLTPKEFSLLEFLAGQSGRALTRDEILRCVWGLNVFVTGRSVDRCVNTLRQKIEADPLRPRHIKTIRQIGYRFETDAAGASASATIL